MPMVNIDSQEVKKFSDIAEDWWNKNGDFKPLHVINPLRANFIKERIELKNKNVLDVGCGGGLLSESLFDFNAAIITIYAIFNLCSEVNLNSSIKSIKLKIQYYKLY